MVSLKTGGSCPLYNERGEITMAQNQKDLTNSAEVTLGGKDKTGQAPYSMANKGVNKAVNKYPSQFVREPFVR